MSGTRGGLGRIVAMGIALALALLLLVAGEATAGKYSVAQCGWYVGADADWADSTGGAKFRPDAYCVPPPGADPFDGAHLKSFTRDGQGTVSGTRFARWRWDAPAGTGITQVRGTWWHALHDGIEQRIGVADLERWLRRLRQRRDAPTRPRASSSPASRPPQPALEDRLLCARAESKWCSLDPGSWSAVRALTITVEDDYAPGCGRRRRNARRRLACAARKRRLPRAPTSGAGCAHRSAGRRPPGVGLTEYPCERRSIGGEWRATTDAALPDRAASGHTPIGTTSFSDGPHSVGHCVTDFAGNVNCLPRADGPDRQQPARPPARARRSPAARAGAAATTSISPGSTPTRARRARSAAPPGGSPARPATTAVPSSSAATSISRLQNLFVPARRRLLAAASGCATRPGTSPRPRLATVPLRFDDVPPGVAFEPAAGGDAAPTQIRAAGRRRALRARRAARSTSAASTPRRGPSCRPSSSAAGAPRTPS